ncbi:MAG: ABC transporter substrate-binding protein [Halobacteriales archaeon]|nr:ABC transporter substrate-binding protein [Halobacteriales archaeon]
MQQSWVEENGTDFINRNLNGTGPFQLTNYDSGNEVTFDRYDDYWGGAAEVGGVTLNASTESSTRVNRLLAEESDIVTNVPPQEVSRVQSADNTAIEAVPSTRIIFLFMRDNVEPFSSPEFRQAMNHAVDVESIIDNILAGFGAATSQPTLPAFVGYNPDLDPYGYDPDMAEQLVEESGHAGAEITLQTPIGRYLTDVEIAQAAADQISQLSNVTCDVEQRDFGAYVQDLLVPIDEMEPEFGLLGWGNGEFDASQTIIPLLTSGSILTTFENEEIDQLMTDAGNEADPDEREAILQEANAILHDEAPVGVHAPAVQRLRRLRPYRLDGPRRRAHRPVPSRDVGVGPPGRYHDGEHGLGPGSPGPRRDQHRHRRHPGLRGLDGPRPGGWHHRGPRDRLGTRRRELIT